MKMKMSMEDMEGKELRTGDLPGHILPAVPLFSISCAFLLMTLKRSIDLAKLPQGRRKSFCELYVPEPNSSVLQLLGGSVFCATMAGVMGSIYVGVFHADAAYFSHVVLYSCYMLVAIVSFLESLGRVPPDSNRVAWSIAMFLNYFMFSEHALMKPGKVDARLHDMYAHACLATCLAMAYSVKFPNSMLAYLAGWATMMIQSLWMFTIAFFNGGLELTFHNLSAYLGFQVLLVVGAIVAAKSYYFPSTVERNNVRDYEEYGNLKMDCDFNNDDDGTDEES